MSFFRELQRRNVIRSLIAYAVGAWLLLQGMDTLTEAFDAPQWIMKLLIGAAVLGFLPVAVISWVYEITSEGIQREVEDGPRHPQGSQRKLDIAIIGMLALAIMLLVYGQLGTHTTSAHGTTNQSELSKPPELRVAPPVVAVLPFSVSSLDGESEFFASGMHDDLLTQLAQLQSLRVISRTSVLEYKETTLNIKEIGEALGADAILEGRVQFAENQLRVNAQLIDAKTDEHLWAQTYDRQLTATGIFNLQTEIARAISDALQTTLTIQDANQLAVLPTENMAAYRAYHQAMEIRDSPGPYDSQAFTVALERAVELDPGFTRALAELAGTYAFRTFNKDIPEFVQKAESSLARIQELAPNSADYYIAQAYYTYYVLRDYDHSLQLITQAQIKAPSDIRLMELKSWIQRRNQDIEGKIETLQVIQSLDPRNPKWISGIVSDLMSLHRYEEAEKELDRTDVQSYRLGLVKNILSQKNGFDPKRYLEASAQVHEVYPKERQANLWEAHIAMRDFAGAQRIAEGKSDAEMDHGHIRLWEGMNLIALWFLEDHERLMQEIVDIREHEAFAEQATLDLALISALEGDAEEATTQVYRWRQEANEDYAEYLGRFDMACKILGIAGVVEPTVACLRTAFTDPSFAVPFIEPYLPFYDQVRDSPAFTALVEEFSH